MIGLTVTASFFLFSFLKNFDFSNTFLSGLVRIGEGSLTISTDLSLDLFVLMFGEKMFLETLGVNLYETFPLKDLLFLLVEKESYLDL